MSTVTITKKEYAELLEKKLRYEYLKQVLGENLFAPPSVRSRKDVISALKSSKRYNGAFLKSIARGLKRSAYFRA